MRSSARSLSALFAVVLTLVVAGSPGDSAAADYPLASGTAGGIWWGQSFNETRGVDVTPVGGALPVQSFTLHGVHSLDDTASVFIGLKVYDTTTHALLLAVTTLQHGGAPVTFNASLLLAPGVTYRICFHVEDPVPGRWSCGGDLFDPLPYGEFAGFPYLESSGRVRVENAWQHPDDVFPTNRNIAIPQVTLGTGYSTSVELVNPERRTWGSVKRVGR